MKNINVNDLIFGKLITPIDIDSTELTKYGEFNSSVWEGKSEYIRYARYYELEEDNYEDVIIKRPSIGKMKIHSKATEILTGEKFDYVIMYWGLSYRGAWEDFEREIKYKPNRRGILDAYILIDPRKKYSYSKEVTPENLLKYMQNHVDIEEYRKELQQIKERSLDLRLHGEKLYKERTQRKKQQELADKQLQELEEKLAKKRNIDLFDNALLLPDLLNEFHCTNNAKKIMFEIIKDDSYMNKSTIEDLLKRIRNKYPNLSEHEYLSLVGVILKLSSNPNKNKPYLKAI